MSRTRTGEFEIGFRRLNGGWQADLASTIAFAKANHFASIETRPDPGELRRITDAGLKLGAVDFPEFGKRLISADKARRDQAVAEDSQILRDGMQAGANVFFTVMLPDDPTLARKDNFGYMVESFTALAKVLEEGGAKLVIEGWPGAGSLVCTPETYRAFFDAVESPTMGVNYDPSHLIRMGIDPIRFLREFADRVYHVHGKDACIDKEGLYQFGHEIEPTFATSPGWGTPVWRYTIPGHGQTRWAEVLRILKGDAYTGMVSIELEDANFNGSEEGEKRGFIESQEFLAGC